MKQQNELFEKFISEFNNSLSDQGTLSICNRLLSFIDKIIDQSCKMQEPDRFGFVITNLINMRDFLSSEIITNNAKILLLNSMKSSFENANNDNSSELDVVDSEISETEVDDKKKLDALLPEDT